MTQLSGLGECALLDKVLQISCRGRARRSGDADVILCAQAALEAVDAFAEYAGDDFLLTLVERAAMLLVELRLGDVEIDAPDGVVLRFQNRVREICRASRDLSLLVVALQCRVIVLALALNRVGERDQAGLTKILRERFFRERAADAAIAVFERVNADEVQMGDARRASAAATESLPPGAVSLNHVMKRFISSGTRPDGGASKCTVRLWIGTGDDLHRIGVRPVAADDLDPLVAAQQHAVPVEHRLVGKCVRKAAVEIDHHLRDAAFSRLECPAFLLRAQADGAARIARCRG